MPGVFLLKEPGRLEATAATCFDFNRTLLRVCPQAPFAFQAVPAAHFARIAGGEGRSGAAVNDWDRLEIALVDSTDALRELQERAEEGTMPIPADLHDVHRLVGMGASCRVGWLLGLPRHQAVRLAASAEAIGADLVVWPSHGGLRPLVRLPPSDLPYA